MRNLLPFPLLRPLAMLLVMMGCASQPRPVAPAEPAARTILATPLADTVGAEESRRIEQMAVVNGLLRHCRLRWEGYFGRMATQQRDDLGRSEAELQRISIWHGYWLGAAERQADRDRVECTGDFQTYLRDQAEALLRAVPPRRAGR